MRHRSNIIATEHPFRILLAFAGNVPAHAVLVLRSIKENIMKKLGYVIAALATIAIAAPSIASAETIVVKRGDHHRFGAHAEMRDHGRHHHDRVVIVKHRHRHGY
jgi:hypothetical protein